MRTFRALGLFALLSACGPSVQQELTCAPSESERATACMLSCAEAANPKSDEEGEDLVLQCEDSCRRLLCHTGQWLYWGGSEWQRCADGNDRAKRACRASGWKEGR